jgi:peptide/nickel transport system substrate-binding protein
MRSRIDGIVVVGALACAALAAGCGGAGTASARYEDPHPLPAEPMVVQVNEVGTYGGRFVLAQTSSPKTFNAIMANETSSTDITQLMFTTLANFDNGKQVDYPELARAYEVAEDGLTWTFHLRRGALFSDGRPITSADVLFSFELAYDDSLHPSIQDLLKPGGREMEVTAPDSYTVVIKSATTYALMVPAVGSLRIMPRHVLEASYRAGDYASAYNASTPPAELVTSGAWTLKEYVPGEKTVLTRNPYWFGVDQENHRMPYLDELVFLVVPDQDAADLKFRAGEVDGVDNVKPENYQWYEDNQEANNYTLHDLGPALNTNFFWFNLNRVREPKPGYKVGQTYLDPVKYRWFSNREFRRACSEAVDRDAMIRSIFFGDAVKNWSTSTPGNKEWHTPGIPAYDYNPEQAKKRLASLGWKDKNGDGFLEDQGGNTISFTMKTNSDNKIRTQIVNFIRDDLAKVGIKVVPAPADFNTLITNLRQDFQYETIVLGLQSGVPPDPGMGQNVWRSSGLTHYWNIKQPRPETPEEAEIDRQMDLLIGTNDMTARHAAWTKIQSIVNEECWVVWLPSLVAKVPVRNRFGNVQPSVIPHRILWNIDRVFVKSRGSRA